MTKERTTTKSSGRTSRQPRSYCCRKKFDHVCQFRIALQDIEPAIWRRIQVPDVYSFWDLHCAITYAFGWLDYHLHQFRVSCPESSEMSIIGIPDDEGFDDQDTLPEWDLSIAKFLAEKNPACEYEYDFGDGWRHSVILEEVVPREEGVVYPRCVAGERACPPEDVGGPWGYQRFLKSIRHLNAAEHDNMLEWVGGWFDPDWFDLDLVRFGNPQKRWDIAFINEPVPKTLRTVQYHRLRQRD